MSYTPTQWNTGDTITASALNKIENGIANSGGGSATIRLDASGMGSSSKNFGYIVYAVYEDGSWVVSSDYDQDWRPLYGHSVPNEKFVVVPLPNESDIGVFILDVMDASRTITGDISTTGTTLYFSYGSVVVGNNLAFKITGNGSYSFVD